MTGELEARQRLLLPPRPLQRAQLVLECREAVPCQGLLSLPQGTAVLCHLQSTGDRAPSRPGLVWGFKG